jgi:hypothetical protein
VDKGVSMLKYKGKRWKNSVDKMWIGVDNFIWALCSKRRQKRWKVIGFVIIVFLIWIEMFVKAVRKIFQ